MTTISVLPRPSRALSGPHLSPAVWGPSAPRPPYRAVTAYRAAELFARGELAWLDAYYAWCRRLGATTVRVYGMWAATGYSPYTFRRYYDQLYDAFLHARRAGLQVHYLALRDQVPDSLVWMPPEVRADHIFKSEKLARDAGMVLFEIGDAATAAAFTGLEKVRVPSMTWEPAPIGGEWTPAQHAVEAAVREESGEGWVIHGGFSSQIDPPPHSDLQNCIVPGQGTPADACARAVAAIWTKE